MTLLIRDLSVRKSRIQVDRESLMCRFQSLMLSLDEIIVLKAELQLINSMCAPMVQVGEGRVRSD